MSHSTHTNEGKKGFTLIELLIVIGVLGVLAGIILVAVDPARRIQLARAARRFSEVNSLLNAILNYTVDNRALPTGGISGGILSSATGTRYQLGSASSTYTCATTSCGGTGTVHESCLDLEADLVDNYIAEIPTDPSGANDDDTFDSTRTGYYLSRSTNGRIEIGSCNPEIESSISIKR